MHDMQEIFRRLVSSIHIAQKYARLAKPAETRQNLAKTRTKRWPVDSERNSSSCARPVEGHSLNCMVALTVQQQQPACHIA